MRLYATPEHYDPARRVYLADVLRPFWKHPPISDAERRRIYGDVVDRYSVVGTVAEADVAVLPMAWNHYHETGQVAKALEYVDRARSAGVKVASWVSGDHGVRVPDPNVVVFRASGYRSTSPPGWHGLPVFIGDPLEERPLCLREKNERPLVGFCGQATTSLLRTGGMVLQDLFDNLRALLPRSRYEPRPLVPHTLMRSRVLDLLEASPLVDTRFVRRERYKGGARTPGDVNRLREEFFDNLWETDYTVCVRGRGNFSARLYETMAASRIPVFVDTDSPLPFQTEIPWRDVCVWVDHGEIHRLADQVAAFHDGLDADGFRAAQLRCRSLWESHLSFPGFLARFPTFFGMDPLGSPDR